MGLFCQRAVALSLFALGALAEETITGYIYCDNYFEFYFNGQLIAKDPLEFTPHQAVKVEFQYDGVGNKTYAILCQDYASDTGYEYTSTDNPQLGDGALLAEFSDGTKTSASWSSYVVTYGPTDASIAAGCSKDNLDVCAVSNNGVPADWYLSEFDDTAWQQSTEYTADEAGWGKSPTWTNGMCGEITSPLTKEVASPSSIATTEDECLKPDVVLCGGDKDCSGDTDGRFIWGANLEHDNIMLFRFGARQEALVIDSNLAADEGTSVQWWGWVLIALAVLGVIGGAVGLVLGAKKKAPAKKKRAVATAEPAAPAPAPAPEPAQATPLVTYAPQYVAAPPMQTVAPVQTAVMTAAPVQTAAPPQYFVQAATPVQAPVAYAMPGPSPYVTTASPSASFPSTYAAYQPVYG